MGTTRSYFTTYPCGIEDAAHDDFERLVSASGNNSMQVQVTSVPASKQELQRNGTLGAAAPSTHGASSTVGASSRAPFSVRGVLFFNYTSEIGSCSVEEEVLFLDGVRRLRTVDRVCLHLLSCPCNSGVDEVNDSIQSHKAEIRNAVVQHLSSMRDTVAHIQERSASMRVVGPYFKSPLADSTVMFRVNCIRRDKEGGFTSQDLAAHVGDQLMEMFEGHGWRVNMLYHNVEFLIIHDHEHHVHLGLVVTPPPLPRVGVDLDPSRQFALEFLRQRIGGDIITGNISDPLRVKALVPRPVVLRNEIRIAKGENAMLVGLAAALTAYAAIEPHMVVLDPFMGSGTILLEAWLAAGQRPLTLLGGELNSADCVLALRNTDACNVGSLSTLHGVMDSCPQTDKAMGHWAEALESFVDALDVSTLSPESTVLLEMPDSVQSAFQAIGQCREEWSNYYVGIVNMDATRLPLAANSVDRVVSDLPFGRRCGNHKVNRRMYPLIIQECHRVLRDPEEGEKLRTADDGDAKHSPSAWWSRPAAAAAAAGGRAVLLTLEGKLMMETLNNLREECPFSLVVPPFAVDMGGLFPFVFVLDKIRK